MKSSTVMADDLQANLELYRQILTLVSKEKEILGCAQVETDHSLHQRKKVLLARLNDSLDKLRLHRLSWCAMSPSERSANPEVAPLLRQNQDLIMKIIVLDRENEQALLRRGMVPARQLPSVNKQRPGFVATLYRRSGNL